MALLFCPAHTLSSMDIIYIPEHDPPPTALQKLMDAIPRDFLDAIPPSALSVRALINLTSVPDTLEKRPSTPPETLLCESAAHDVSLAQLLGMTVPPLDYLSAVRSSISAAQPPPCSIHHPHFDIPLPLWVILWWEAMHVVSSARQQWIHSSAWLDTVLARAFHNDQDFHECVTTAQSVLDVLPYGESIRVGDTVTPTWELTRILRDGLLGNNIMDCMCAALSERLHVVSDSSGNGAQTAIFHTGYTTTLLKLATDSRRLYSTAGDFRSLRSIGKKLSTSEIVQILIPYFLPALGHWATLQILRTSDDAVEIAYGDSLNYRVPQIVLDAVLQWLGFLQLRVVGPLRNLEHGLQQDTISCGIVAVNTIEVAAFHVPKFRPQQRDTFRIVKFIELAAVQQHGVRPHCIIYVQHLNL